MAETLTDAAGRPIDQAALKEQQATVNLGSVRRPSTEFVATGLTPQRLARLLRDSVDGDPRRFLQLAEDIEERDLHYAAVLSNRKRQVAGLEIIVEAASDQADDIAAADLVRSAVRRDVFEDELIDLLDGLGKGFACAEILWDTSERQWMPRAIEWAHPTWFEFDRDSLTIPLLRSDKGLPEPLKPAGWIVHRPKIKSGIPIRGGLARAAAWSFLWKEFDLRDWAIFLESYGQPVRLGKYDTTASDADRETMARALASVGVDFYAMIPASMQIELLQSDTAAPTDMYLKRADWLDQQVSKLVLGQVGTTDAVAGGFAGNKIHRMVADDIERADARQLAATLNRDLVRPLVDLNMGPRKAYPYIRIGRPDEIDIDALVKNVSTLGPAGLKVSESWMRDKLCIPDPDAGEDLLDFSGGAVAAPVDPAAPQASPVQAASARIAAATGPLAGTDAIDEATRLALADQGWVEMVGPVLDQMEQALADAQSLDDVERIIADQVGKLDVATLTKILARTAFAARLAGLAGDDLSDAT